MSATETPISKDWDTAIGRRVHQLMWDNRTSQTALAATLGLGQSALSKKLRGEQGFSPAQLVAVAIALNTTVAFLFGESDDPHPDPATERRTRPVTRW